MAADTVEEPSSVDNEKNDVYLTEHLADHISATRYHLTGRPEHPEPPYAPSFHPPTGYWTPTEKALLFHALSVHSRLRPDLIAASIGTKSTVDVAIYLLLLRQGANKSTTRSHGPTITIERDQHPAAHQVSEELVTFEDQQAALICTTEPMHTEEAESKARAETLRSLKNGIRVPRGEGKKGRERDRKGQLARKDEFERLRAEREIVWDRDDALARLDSVSLQVLDRMLRVDEERRAKAGSDDEEEEEERMSSTMPHPVASSSSLAGELHTATPPPSSPLATTTPNDSEGDAGAGAVPSNLSPASRRLITKRLYMRRKRAEASGGTVQLDPARLKPGRKESTTSKCRPPKKPRGDGHGVGDGEVPNSKRPVRGYTRPYKIQREFERVGISVDYLRENDLDLFHLGALGRLMRLYPRLDASRPENVGDSIAQETIQTLQTLVVQFTRNLVQCAITLRELDFALRAHTKVWRLGERVVRPPHVRRALELRGCARLDMRTHFEKLAERYSEGEESEDEDEDEDEDVPLAVRARKAIVPDQDEDEDEDVNSSIGEREQQQQAGPSKDVQADEVAWERWSSSHRAIYSPFVYAPDLIASAHPFGVYVPGTVTTMPELGHPSQSYSSHVIYQDYDDDDEAEEEEERDLMPIETDEEALEVELKAEALLDAADARAAAAYEAGIWRELRRSAPGAPLRRSRKRRRSGDGGEDDGNLSSSSMRLRTRTRKRRNNLRASTSGGAYDEGAADLESLAGGVRASAAVVEDSDC